MLSPSGGASPTVQLKPDTSTNTGATQGGAPPAASVSSFGGLKALVTQLGGQVRTGQFADASFKAAIPIPQVPGLSVTFGVEGSFAVDDKQQKELSVSISGGVKYALGSLFNVNGAFNEALKLKGNDLGAALVDAVKQTIYWTLEKLGVHGKFAEMVKLAKDGPGFWDYAKVLVPVYGSYQAAKLAVSQFGADKLLAAHDAFFEFFKNYGSVGFEASVGLGVGGGVKAGNVSGGVKLEGRVGLEDVNNKKTEAFAEVAGELSGAKGNSTAEIRFGKRWREGGSKKITIDVSAALSMPKTAFGAKGAESLMREAGFLWSIISVARALNKAEKDAKIGEVMNLFSSVLGLGSQVFGNNTNFDSLMGLDISVSETNGVWSVDKARVKTMTQIGTGTGVTSSSLGVEANVRLGTFIDVGAVLNTGLQKLAGK